MAKRQAVLKAQKKPTWSPWVALLCLLGVLFAFVAYPYIRGEHKVKVEFDQPN